MRLVATPEGTLSVEPLPEGAPRLTSRTPKPRPRATTGHPIITSNPTASVADGVTDIVTDGVSHSAAAAVAMVEPHPKWGLYRRRAVALGVESVGEVSVMAYDCVGEEAVAKACHLVRCMLRDSPASLVHRLAKAQCQV